VTTNPPQLALQRIVNAPRARLYEAFTVPEHFAAWWGPDGNALDHVVFAIRPGGYLRWSEVFASDAAIWTHGRVDLTEVVEGELLDGIMRITGELPGGYEPFETRLRIEFYDEPDQRTRLEIYQWLPEEYVSPSENGWSEALAKLDVTLGV
jgi:uncharacterized protein YndB with AHSA1/START domain